LLAVATRIRHTALVATAATAAKAIDWPVLMNVHGGPTLWFAAWLVGDRGEEAGACYNGRGGERIALAPPPSATGIRVYRWRNEGLDPEYCDIELPAGTLDAAALDFDRPQRYSRLRLHPDD
jgi:hypothetical protein